MAYLRISILVLSLVFLSVAFSEAKEVIVGGKYISWNVDSSKTLNEWIQSKRFKVGDQLSNHTFQSPFWLLLNFYDS